MKKIKQIRKFINTYTQTTQYGDKELIQTAVYEAIKMAEAATTLALTKERVATVLINTIPKISLNQIDLVLSKLGFKL